MFFEFRVCDQACSDHFPLYLDVKCNIKNETLYHDNSIDIHNYVKYKWIPEKAENFSAVFYRLIDNFIMSVNKGDMLALIA